MVIAGAPTAVAGAATTGARLAPESARAGREQARACLAAIAGRVPPSAKKLKV